MGRIVAYEIKGNLNQLQVIVDQLKKMHKTWDIIYTDVDYHNANTGELIVPKLQEIPNNKRIINQNVSRVLIRYGTVSFVISDSGMRKVLDYFRHNWNNLPYDQVLFKIPGLIIYGANSDIITNRYKIKTSQEEEDPLQLVKKRPFYQTNSGFWINPIELLTFDRFDVMAKYIYAKYKLNHYVTNWHVGLYKSHLEKWIQFYNTEPLKIGFQDFQAAFNILISSLYNRNFDENFPIPINNLGLACDGSHRTGACLALGDKIPAKVKVQEGQGSPGMSAAVFRDKYHLEEKYLDHMAYEYAKLKKNTFMVCLFPSGYEHLEKSEEILKKYGIIVHYKDIWLNDSGCLEFVRLAYTGEWWTGSYVDNFKHSRSKASLCFPMELRKKYPVRVYLYESSDERVVRKAKAEIRDLCQKGNESIHINDTHQQTKIIAASVFNQNSLDFLNKKNLNLHKRFDFLLEKFKDFIEEYKIDPETICIDTGAVLAAYGLRECDDLDVLHKHPLPTVFADYEIDSHNSHVHHHSKQLDEILFNPECYFYYQGIKFVKLELVEKMKADRGSEKDWRDIRLIQSLKYSEE